MPASSILKAFKKRLYYQDKFGITRVVVSYMFFSFYKTMLILLYQYQRSNYCNMNEKVSQ